MTKFMMKMFAAWPEPEGTFCAILWFALVSSFRAPKRYGAVLW